MVKTMNIECPSCTQNFRLYLSIDTSMVILDCPMCCTSIIYYKSRTFQLSKHQMENIKKCEKESNVLKILHKITAQEPKVPCSHKYIQHYNTIERHSSIIKSDFDYISSDDIINLKIELETCQDSAYFIERL
jgi:hypothetical protein